MPTLKEWRARRVLTVQGLAKAAGVAPSTVYRLENDRSQPTFGAIRALSGALGVQPEEVEEFAAAIAAVGQGKAIGEGRLTHERPPSGEEHEDGAAASLTE